MLEGCLYGNYKSKNDWAYKLGKEHSLDSMSRRMEKSPQGKS